MQRDSLVELIKQAVLEGKEEIELEFTQVDANQLRSSVKEVAIGIGSFVEAIEIEGVEFVECTVTNAGQHIEIWWKRNS